MRILLVCPYETRPRYSFNGELAATSYLPKAGSAEEETSLRPYKTSLAPSLAAASAQTNHLTSPIAALNRVLVEQDLYAILEIPNTRYLDPQLLRRSYLSIGKTCHPECVPVLSNQR